MTENTFVQIRCRNGSLAGQSFFFIEPGLVPFPNPLRIGRHQDAHIRFCGAQETMVSRVHAELRYEDGLCSLHDAGSSFGMFLVPGHERISRLSIPRGGNFDVQFGPQGPICHISLGGAIPFGPYLLTSKLGEGGMGEVYVGWDTRLNRQIVLKLLREEMHGKVQGAQNLLLTEARVVSQLEHPNVVRVYDLGEESGVVYLAMEYIRGINLGELRRSTGFIEQRLPPRLAAGIMHQVCLGLHAAHQLPIQVVHRDISLGNVMLTSEGVKVIDFGLARCANRIGQSITEDGRIAGSPPYMSPEQIKSPRDIDRRSDLFSTAAVLYLLCTGQSPFARESQAATMSAVLFHVPPPLRALCPEASPQLESIIHTALCKDPAGRQATAAELAAQLLEQAGPEFSNHVGIMRGLRALGVELQAPPPEPLVAEPPIVQRARLRKPVVEEPKMGVALPVPNLLGRTIANGRYTLQKLLSQTSAQGAHLAWKQHYLADDGAPQSEGEVVVTLCGGLEANNGLSQRHAARVYKYIAHRIALGGGAGLPAVLDHGEAWPEGPIYLVTPYLPVRLNQGSNGSLTTREALRIVAQVAAALRAEQKRDPSYVHGDIRPENIAIEEPRSGKTRVLLLDFSLGSIVQLPLLQRARVERSPYVPPEEVDVTRSLTAQDVFALGVLFYEICGGDIAAARQCLDDDQELPALPTSAQAASDPEATAALFGALRAEPGMRPGLAELCEILAASAADASTSGERVASSPSLAAEPQIIRASPPARTIVRLNERVPSKTLPVGRSRHIHIESIYVRPHEVREPVTLPLNLQGLLPGCHYPLMIVLSHGSMELRVCAEALNGGRAVRIYQEVMASAARNTYALSGDFSERELYCGHHRGLLHTMYVSRQTSLAEDASRRIALPKLGLDLEIPDPASSMLTLWRAAQQSGEVHLATIVVKDS